MTIYAWKSLFLGTAADIDTDETSRYTENESILLGTWGSAGDPLWDGVVDTTIDDANEDNLVGLDNTFETTEVMTIDGVPTDLDSSVLFSATITYVDGTTVDITAMVFQTSTGDVYLAPEYQANADAVAMDAKLIESVELTGVLDDHMYLVASRQPTTFTCFVSGTHIATQMGEVRVEDLQVGDRVFTLDNGFQTLRWIGSKTIVSTGKMAPIRVAQGALGSGVPTRDLLLSPQHRLLVRSKIVHRMTGSTEALVPAVGLVDETNVTRMTSACVVTYYHLLFDRHEVIFSEGAPTESLYLGEQGQNAMGPAARAEIEALFPELLHRKSVSARPILQGPALRNLVMRHTKNDKNLVSRP